MINILDQRVVTTRKPHRCAGCNLLWPAGTEMHRVKHADMGSVCNDYWCLPCDKLADEYTDENGEFDHFLTGSVRTDDEPRWHATATALGVTPPNAAGEAKP